jgi:hypothetical protein
VVCLLTSKKNKKATRKRDNSQSPYPDNIQSIRSWLRKVEQMTNSVSSRLSAVEKRISGGKREGSPDIVYGDFFDGPIEHIFTTLQQERREVEVDEVGRIFDTEFSLMQQELISQHQELAELKSLLQKNNLSLHEIKTSIAQIKQVNRQKEKNISIRLEKIEKREPPVVRFGSMEIPMEISGVIGGLLAFIIAALVLIGQKYILLSPIFLSLVGVLLISSAMIKTFRIGNDLSEPIQKTNRLKDHL